MSVKKGETVELAVTDLAYGGMGVAHHKGMTVFVEQSAPQDRVLARIIKKKRRFAIAKVAEIIEPSPLRVEPPCRYSSFCGGCTWQFLDYPAQLRYKGQAVAEALVHIGGMKDIPVHDTIPSDPIYGYRNKMEFSCADSRWLLPQEMEDPDAEKGLAIGLHVPGTFYKILDIEACLLQPQAGNAILEDIRAFIKSSPETVYGIRSHAGFWRFVMLRHSVALDQWMVNIITAAEKREAVEGLADLLRRKHPAVVSVVNNINPRKAGIAVGEYQVGLAGAETIEDRIGPFEFEVSANSFFQTNTRGAQRLYETVKRYAQLSGSETVLDLYSGTGTIAIFLAQGAGRVIGLELVEAAVRDAEKNCRRNGISNCRFVQGDIKDSLAALSIQPDVIIIDPPRAGMHKDVVTQVTQMAAGRIIYVSCNPATLARDLGLLQADYRIKEIQPLDMFPHTYHVEAVARLERR